MDIPHDVHPEPLGEGCTASGGASTVPPDRHCVMALSYTQIFLKLYYIFPRLIVKNSVIFPRSSLSKDSISFYWKISTMSC